MLSAAAIRETKHQVTIARPFGSSGLVLPEILNTIIEKVIYYVSGLLR